jgi:hypothetical protein
VKKSTGVKIPKFSEKEKPNQSETRAKVILSSSLPKPAPPSSKKPLRVVKDKSNFSKKEKVPKAPAKRCVIDLVEDSEEEDGVVKGVSQKYILPRKKFKSESSD